MRRLRTILIASAIGLIVLTGGVTMWRTSGESSELASVLGLSDKKVLADTTVVPSQPDPDSKPTAYFAVVDSGQEGFTRLADALEASKPTAGPMFSSPLNWQLVPGVQFDAWDESYPDTTTLVFHVQRGKWEVWAKFQNGRTFLIATKTESE
jgi:hypothetical protein